MYFTVLHVSLLSNPYCFPLACILLKLMLINCLCYLLCCVFFFFLFWRLLELYNWFKWKMPRNPLMCSQPPCQSNCLHHDCLFIRNLLFYYSNIRLSFHPYICVKLGTGISSKPFVCVCHVHRCISACGSMTQQFLPRWPQHSRPFRVINSDRSIKKGIMAYDLKDLQNKVRAGIKRIGVKERVKCTIGLKERKKRKSFLFPFAFLSFLLCFYS